MKHIFLLLSLMLILSCSQGIAKPIEHSLVVTSDKEIISDLDFIENKIIARSVNEEKNNLALKIIPELISSDARLGISGSFIELNQ